MFDSVNPIKLAMLISLAIHGIILSVQFHSASRQIDNKALELEVTLVSGKTDIEVSKALLLAQHNLNGGGNIKINEEATTNLPGFKSDSEDMLNISSQRIKKLEETARKLMAKVGGLDANQEVSTVEVESSRKGDLIDADEQLRKSFELAKLKSKIAKNWREYQKMPRRDFIGVQAKKAIYAEYVESWREKIEEIGTKNFPKSGQDAAVYGDLLVTVSINSDGTLEEVKLERGSGYVLLDKAVKEIVKMSSPFKPFPPKMRRQTDILSITRNWRFTRSDLIISNQL